MPMKKMWLLRLPEIRTELEALPAPVIDRAMIEQIFGVRRRRALQLMQYFGGWQSGQACLVDRLDLLVSWWATRHCRFPPPSPWRPCHGPPRRARRGACWSPAPD